MLREEMNTAGSGLFLILFISTVTNADVRSLKHITSPLSSSYFTPTVNSLRYFTTGLHKF